MLGLHRKRLHGVFFLSIFFIHVYMCVCVHKPLKLFHFITPLKVVKMILDLGATSRNLQQIRLIQSYACDFTLTAAFAAELLSSAYQRRPPIFPPPSSASSPPTPTPTPSPRAGDLQRCWRIGRQRRCQHHLCHLSCSAAGCSACDKTRGLFWGPKILGLSRLWLAAGRSASLSACRPTTQPPSHPPPPPPPPHVPSCHSVKAKAG